jgi:hypothetical protein
MKPQLLPWLRRAIAGFSLLRPRFDPVSVHVGSVVDTAALNRFTSYHFGLTLSVSFDKCSVLILMHTLLLFLS